MSIQQQAGLVVRVRNHIHEAQSSFLMGLAAMLLTVLLGTTAAQAANDTTDLSSDDQILAAGNDILADNDTSTVIDGFDFSNADSGDFFVGTSGTNNTLLITNGGHLFDVATGWIGYLCGADSNTGTVTGAGSEWDMGDLYVGNSGANNGLVIAAGGTLNTACAWIGNDLTALSNSVLVTDAGSVWYNGDTHIGACQQLQVLQQASLSRINSAGDDPAGLALASTGTIFGANSLTIANGGQVFGGNGYVGEDAQLGFNAALVTGAGSLWNNGGDLTIGTAAVGNTMVVADQGQVANMNATIGVGLTAVSNAVVVIGAGSCWRNGGDLHIGAADDLQQAQQVLQLLTDSGGSQSQTLERLSSGLRVNQAADDAVTVANANSLTIADGGVVMVGAPLDMGGGTAILTLTQANADTTGLAISQSGDDAAGLAISQQMPGGNSFIGDLPGAGGNTVLVTGPGSLWSNACDLVIGNQGSGNSLTVTNGGQVINANGTIGKETTALSNSVVVSGAGSCWLNAEDLHIGSTSANAIGLPINVHGDGYCVFQRPDGVQCYARTQTLHLDANGLLCSAADYPIMGGDGVSPIGFITLQAGSFTINSTGIVLRGDAVAGQVVMAGFQNPAGLTTDENGYFLETADSGCPMIGMAGTCGLGTFACGLGNAGNSLVISDGGMVLAGAPLPAPVTGGDDAAGLSIAQRLRGGVISVGDASGMSNNTVLVSGAGSVLSNDDELVIGNLGPGNQMTIRDGATVFGARGAIGSCCGADNNSVLVSGPGAVWSNSLYLFLGANSSDNQLTVAEGGETTANLVTIGGVSTGNLVHVTGCGSRLDNLSVLTLGLYGSRNRLQIDEGGQVTSPEVNVGASSGTVTVQTGPNAGNSTTFYASADSNQVLIAGNGARLNVNDHLRLGICGTGNGLTVGEGGELRVTNFAQSATLQVISGTLTLNGGVVAADAFTALDGPGSVVVFNAGTCSFRRATVANGAPFVVGNGVQSATLRLLGGANTFADGLVIARQAGLCGGGSIAGGAVTVAGGGALTPDAASGDLAFAGDLTLAGTWNAGVRSNSGTVARLDVAGTLNITGGRVDFAALAGLNTSPCILASYGVLTGAPFLSVDNPPDGFVLDYQYGPSSNQIALVRSAVPGANTAFRYESDGTSIAIEGYTGAGGDVVIPDTIDGLPVTSIGGFVFADCTNLTSVAIGSHVTTIDGLAFTAAGTNLTAIAVDAGNAVFSSLDGVLCDKSQTTLLLYPAGRGGTYTIPGGVIRIDDWAFAGASLSDVIIPDSVASIGRSAFQECGSLTHVTLGSHVASIGDWAFFLCSSLQDIAIPAGVTDLGYGVFADCASLTAIAVDSANPAYSSVAGVLFDKYQTTLIQYPTGRPGTDFVVAAGVSVIGGDAFSGCTNLANVAMTDSVTAMGQYAFADCTGLTNVTLSANLDELADYVFADCTSLMEVTIPEGVTRIGNGTFAGCSLTDIMVPGSVTSLGDCAFEECWFALKSVRFQGDAPSLGTDVFGYDDGAIIYYQAGTSGWGPTFGGFATVLWQPPVTVTVTASPTQGGTVTGSGTYWMGTRVAISASAAAGWQFGGWSDGVPDAWRVMVAPTTNSAYTAIFIALPPDPNGHDDQYFWTIQDGAVTIVKYTGPGGDVVIPDTLDGLPVIGIGHNAFESCAALTSVTIPNSVTNIGDSAFNSCTGLTHVALPSGLSCIRNFTFYWCTALTDISIPESVTCIGDWAFAACTRLSSATIPAGLDCIGAGAFCSCFSLTDLYFRGQVPSLGDYAFLGADETTLHYLQGAVGWDTTVGGRPAVMQPVYSYTTNGTTIVITGYAGAGGAVTVPGVLDGLPVTCIGDGVFASCTGLTSVTVPASVTRIGNNAFAGCAGLTEISFLGNAPLLDGSSVFAGDAAASVHYLQGTEGWESLYGGVPTAMQILYTYTANAGAITITRFVGTVGAVTIPGTLDGLPVTCIGNDAFAFCDSLTSVVIPGSVTNIGESAFMNCTSLTDVVLPDGITCIRNFTFYWCTHLTSVVLPDSVTAIGAGAFSACTKLTSFTVPAHVASIGSGAFGACYSLTNVTIPGSVTRIEDNAFMNCTSLSCVYFCGAPPDLGDYVFVGNTHATAYYQAGTAGFGATFGGLPTTAWYSSTPPVSTATAAPPTVSRNLQLRMQGGAFIRSNQFCFAISGASNAIFVVEACTNLTQPVWFPVATKSMTGDTAEFSDPNWTNYPTLYYRVRAP